WNCSSFWRSVFALKEVKDERNQRTRDQRFEPAASSYPETCGWRAVGTEFRRTGHGPRSGLARPTRCLGRLGGRYDRRTHRTVTGLGRASPLIHSPVGGSYRRRYRKVLFWLRQRNHLAPVSRH